MVNAFGNLKKALHLRIDMLLYHFGLFEYHGQKKFARMLKLKEEVGILPTKMLANINEERTFVEHEYTVPAEKRVAEVLDVIQMLYMVSDKVLERLMAEALVGLSPEALGGRGPAHAILRVEPVHGELRFFEIKPMLDVRNLRISGGDVEVVDYRPRPIFKEEPEYMPADSPFWVLRLDSEQKEKWLPIIKEIVDLSTETIFSGGKWTKIGGSDDYLVTTTVTFPHSMAQEEGLTEATRKKLAERVRREREGPDAS